MGSGVWAKRPVASAFMWISSAAELAEEHGGADAAGTIDGIEDDAEALVGDAAGVEEAAGRSAHDGRGRGSLRRNAEVVDVGKRDLQAWPARSRKVCLICAAWGTGKAMPSRRRNLMPFQWSGLCEAVMTMEASALRKRPRRAMEGVVAMPASTTSMPTDSRPAESGTHDHRAGGAGVAADEDFGTEFRVWTFELGLEEVAESLAELGGDGGVRVWPMMPRTPEMEIMRGAGVGGGDIGILLE